jgi:hypothetical protein
MRAGLEMLCSGNVPWLSLEGFPCRAFLGCLWTSEQASGLLEVLTDYYGVDATRLVVQEACDIRVTLS